MEPVPSEVGKSCFGRAKPMKSAGMQAGGTIYGKTGEAEIDGGSHAWFTGYRDDDIAFATLVVLGAWCRRLSRPSISLLPR